MLYMVKHNMIKLSIIVITLAMLGSIAPIMNPAKMAYGQDPIDEILGNITNGDGNMTQGNMTRGNMTQGNMTAVIDVDTLAKNIKERHPILAQMAANEDQDLMMRIKDMDAKEAAKTTIALNMLGLLQQYKQLDVE